MFERVHPSGPRAALGCAAAAALGLAVAALLYGLLTGPRGESHYPPRAESPYRLPWPKGVERLCVQGNRGVVSHRDRGEFAYDFAMPVGSTVLAARGGRVVRVVDRHDGRGTQAPNNLVVIEHGDGTRGHYLHLEQGGAQVEVGQRVRQGQAIGRSGNVGRSLLPHLHFHVTGRAGTVPITFADVEADRGIPRMFKRYVSGNTPAEQRRKRRVS